MSYTSSSLQDKKNNNGTRQAAIEVQNVSMAFKKRQNGLFCLRPSFEEVKALAEINFTVNKGEIYGILGSNGSGKSTLIRAISTLLLPDTGQVKIFGMDIVEYQAQVRHFITRVSVDAAFFKKLSPRENLLYSARLYGVNPKEAEKKSLEILERLGVRKKAFYEPLEEMSRGMQQKVAIARAFLAAPVLVLLDEPTTGLDPKSRRDVQEFILELRDAHDATILITTHDMPEADRVCDRIAFIHKGRFVAEDSPEALKASLSSEASLEDVFLSLTGEEIA